MRRVVLLVMFVLAGCAAPPASLAPASSIPSATVVEATPSPVVPTIAIPSPTPTPRSTFALVPNVTFAPTDWGKPWQILGGKLDPNDPLKAIENLQPPDGVYVLDWVISGISCSGLLENGTDIWSFDATRTLEPRGLALADIIHADENPYRMFTSGCDGWAVALRPVETYFGPNSVQVARLIIHAHNLGPDWERVADEVISPEALAIEALVLDAAKRDPNLGAALHNALASSWEFRNRYLEENPAAALLRRLGITAEVAQPLLPAREFDTLYGPLADYIDPLDLGLPVHS